MTHKIGNYFIQSLIKKSETNISVPNKAKIKSLLTAIAAKYIKWDYCQISSHP